MSGKFPVPQVDRIVRSFTVFAATLLLAATARAGTEQVLYPFTGGADGYFSTTGVVMDPSGNLYGVTNFGGSSFDGTIYELTPNGSGGYTYNLIHSFENSEGNGFANNSLLLDGGGNLYGLAESGGPGNSGTVFELSPGAGGWTLTVLYAFHGGKDGSVGEGNLVMDAAGNLYGVTTQGGDVSLCTNGCGTVFELIHSGSVWTKQEIYRFHGKGDGAFPQAGVVFDSSGSLYGTTSQQGIFSKRCTDGCGTVFKLSPPASGHIWTETVLHRFTDADGSTPVEAVTLDGQGNVYVPTSVGGNLRCGLANGCGAIVEVSPSSGGWSSKVLYTFAGQKDGGAPTSPLISDISGNLYGSTFSGGSNGWGEIFELSPGASGWTKTEVYSFTSLSDGGDPGGPLVRDASGNLFGHTYLRGQYGEGVVFEVTP